MLSSYWDDFPSRSPMGWRMPLQVQRKGGFFTDSMFQGTRNHFDSAIRDIMRSSSVSDTNDQFKSYRMHRDRQLSGADRPSSLVEEDTIFKVVMDVQGFIDNDLKVTFLHDNELVVEGMIEKKTEGSLARQSFKRRFVLPKKVIVNEATSALSSDNILTITIPKQLQQITSGEQNVSSTVSSSSNMQTQAVSSGLNQMMQDSSTSQKISSSLASNDMFDSSLKSLMEFPIARKNDFLADSFFDNVRNMFQSRVQEIMNRRSHRDATEDVNIFRSLRDKEDQNVAVTVAGDTNEHKIVLDVHGFSEGDLTVKAITETELLVEGKVERKTDNSCCNNSFRRNFCLPNNVDLQGARSALSSDGVLTIIIPKKPEKPLPIEYSIPVTREDTTTSASRASKLRMEKLSEIRSSQERSIPSPTIPLGYPGDNLFNQSLSETTSTQQRTVGGECIIPVTLEGASPLPNVEPLSKKLTTMGLNQTTDSSSTTSRNLTEVKSREEKASHEQRSSQLTDQSWKDVQVAPQFNSRLIPINMRGSFCNDRIFDSARQRVESAVQNAMIRSTSREDQQKQTHLTQQQTTQMANNAATSTILDDVNNYKISLDVFGFSQKDLSIKIVSRNEISVEGVTEQKKDGAISRHSFERTFHLPDTVIIESVTSDLSSEGMLTITLPKKKPDSVDTVIPVTRASQAQSIDTRSASQTVKTSDTTRQTTGEHREYVVPLVLEGSTDSTLRKDLLETQQKTQSSLNETSTLGSIASLATDRQTSEKSLATEQNLSQTRDIAIKPCFDLPIANKGHFYQDSFFNDSHDMFDSALTNAMTRFNSFSSFSNDLDFFKTLRQERVGSESQTAALSEDNQFHKVVVDVQGYPQECLKVKVIEQNGILVEGRVEEKAGNASSTKSFRRTFFLPQCYNVQKAVTALSSDGVLNIKVPRGTEQSFLTL